MKRRFVVTPEAKKDLKEILLDIAADSPDVAERLRPAFFDSLQFVVAKSPGNGRE